MVFKALPSPLAHATGGNFRLISKRPSVCNLLGRAETGNGGGESQRGGDGGGPGGGNPLAVTPGLINSHCLLQAEFRSQAGRVTAALARLRSALG